MTTKKPARPTPAPRGAEPRARPVRASAARTATSAKNAAAKNAATAPRILAAADELFCRRGYGGVSMRDVAAAAHVPKGLVFYHFESKDALFARVLEGYYQAHTEALSRAFALEGSRSERLHRLVDAYLDFIAAHRRYAALVQRAVAEPEAHPLIAANLTPLYEWIEGALAALTPAVGPLAARHFFITFSGLTINYFTYAPLLASAWGKDPMSPEALAERRAHVHWVVDVLLERLEAGALGA